MELQHKLLNIYSISVSVRQSNSKACHLTIMPDHRPLALRPPLNALGPENQYEGGLFTQRERQRAFFSGCRVRICTTVHRASAVGTDIDSRQRRGGVHGLTQGWMQCIRLSPKEEEMGDLFFVGNDWIRIMPWIPIQMLCSKAASLWHWGKWIELRAGGLSIEIGWLKAGWRRPTFLRFWCC